jgi:hypothetical protein
MLVVVFQQNYYLKSISISVILKENNPIVDY